mgnify:CR=1 FL=1
MPPIDGLEVSLNDHFQKDEVLDLYRANGWSAAEKPDKLLPALRNAHSLVTARLEGRLIGIGNAISDGFLVVYYPHLLVHPDYQNQGIGRAMMTKLLVKYSDFHQQMLTADQEAIGFYESMGFVRAGQTEPMWIYGGVEH